jgi:pimeloyl-ACP methyl ester carboxylesterase
MLRDAVTDTILRETGFVASRDERIYWESHGSGDPLVLCHGAGGHHTTWFQQVPVLARRRRVVTWDHAGFGLSTDRAGVSGPLVAVEDLRAVLGSLGLERVDLVGQSMGGWTALGFALAEPARVRRLVLADSLAGLSSPAISAHLRRLAAATAAALPSRPAGAPVPQRLGAHPALDPSFVARDPVRAHLYQALAEFAPDLRAVGARLLAHAWPAAALRDFAVPVLIVVGERDALFPPALLREAALLFRDARVVEIPGCGHSPYFEEPEAWNRAVEAFLDDQRS